MRLARLSPLPLVLPLLCVVAGVASTASKLIIVTGANSGIGKECCRHLAALGGYRVMMACRNVTAGHEAANDILRQHPDACVECHPLDLASFSSVRSFAKSAVGGRAVSAVIHNAGVMAVPYRTTVDGHELTFQVNHLAQFFLTELLLPNLRRAYRDTGELSRVVIVASGAHRWASTNNQGAAGGLARGAGAAQHEVGAGGISYATEMSRGWGKWQAYAGSKLCNVLYAAELTRRYGGEDSGVVGVAVRPGTVRTAIARHSPLLRFIFTLVQPFLTSVEKAGEVVSNAAVDPYVAAGAYYDKDVRTPASAAGQDMELQAALWAVTMNILVSGGDLQRAVDLG
ncbi:putative oxidoreductase [Ectocarpus siliculosus]|uniref:Oxidoreductase n=1 Tax=Ectocarpus siliculosus TaxID=2880 RepID=D7FQ66_ECTSI|nr:putative oxidoreductase [Ectocarpus siliculosus]|eukprot:CBJ48398.1 putative oxidoreductase [Ectocarpus siliculosus]